MISDLNFWHWYINLFFCLFVQENFIRKTRKNSQKYGLKNHRRYFFFRVDCGLFIQRIEPNLKMQNSATVKMIKSKNPIIVAVWFVLLPKQILFIKHILLFCLFQISSFCTWFDHCRSGISYQEEIRAQGSDKATSSVNDFYT